MLACDVRREAGKKRLKSWSEVALQLRPSFPIESAKLLVARKE